MVAVTTTNFVWFALTYFVYLSTQSVISTSIVAGITGLIVTFVAMRSRARIDYWGRIMPNQTHQNMRRVENKPSFVKLL